MASGHFLGLYVCQLQQGEEPDAHANSTNVRARPTRPHSKATIDLMTTFEQTGTERLVKSTDRVRDLGEVFTPTATVQAMLDLLPPDMWGVHPSPTFLEPACGDGNFLVGPKMQTPIRR